jgi:predicted house-cleaning noncanonical NTP pyrophosphatase (MazG superfamily)
MQTKLIRDKINPLYDAGMVVGPANSRAGKFVLLINKIHEKASALAEDATNIDEYTDLLEAVKELAYINEITWADIEAAEIKNKEIKGGFVQGKVITSL